MHNNVIHYRKQLHKVHILPNREELSSPYQLTMGCHHRHLPNMYSQNRWEMTITTHQVLVDNTEDKTRQNNPHHSYPNLKYIKIMLGSGTHNPLKSQFSNHNKLPLN